MIALRVDCLRSGAIRIFLALILGLLIVPGYVVVPVLFAEAGSRSLAGHLAGQLFHIANGAILIMAFITALFWRRMEAGRCRWGLLGAVVLMVAVNEFGIASVLANLKESMGSIDAVPKDDPVRRSFGIWHGASSLLHLFTSIAAAGLVILGDGMSKEQSCRC
jgi:hypothetical protein